MQMHPLEKHSDVQQHLDGQIGFQRLFVAFFSGELR